MSIFRSKRRTSFLDMADHDAYLLYPPGLMEANHNRLVIIITMVATHAIIWIVASLYLWWHVHLM
jgi:hypothetical protein